MSTEGIAEVTSSMVYSPYRGCTGMTIRFDIDLGLNTLKGVLTLRAKELGVEWRRYDLFEAPVGPLESISVPFADLAEVSVRRRPLRPTIQVIAHSASTFGPMPLPAGDLATLRAKVARADRGQAEAWGAEANLRVADAMTGKDLLE
jgi:hypothetical protein